MKKQIVSILSKISLAITLVVSMGATQMLFMPATVKAAPAKCYTTIGFLQVEPTTTVCSVDPGGRITYFDLDNVLVPQPEDNACYTGERTGGNDTFQSRRFQEASCVDLETLRTQARRSYCDASGGEWVPGSGPRPPSCRCPDTSRYNNTTCVPIAETAPTENPGNSIPQAQGPEECEKDDNQCCESAGGDLTAENCGIVGLLNTVFNFISGGVALAVIGNIIYAGIQYSMAQGDPSAVGKAKNRIRGALVAFLLYLVLYAFLQWLIPGGVFFA